MHKITRRGSVRAGKISALALIRLDPLAKDPKGELVTAVRESHGDLKLIKWHVESGGHTITRGADASAGAVDEVAVTVVHQHVITAVRDSHGHLKLIAWSSGLHRQGEASAGDASHIAIVSLAFDAEGRRFATALRDSAGNLKLIAWRVSSSGDITRLGEATAGGVREVTFVRVDGELGNDTVVTSVVTQAGHLKVIAWYVSDDGHTITRRQDGEAGAASLLSAARYGALVATPLRNGEGNLEVIVWGCSAVGEIFREHTLVAGAVGASSGVWTLDDDAHSDLTLTTAVCNGEGNLELIDWFLHSSVPTKFERGPQALAGRISRVAIELAHAPDPAKPKIVVTAVQNHEHELELIAWERH